MIRRARVTDAAQIADIENQAFAHDRRSKLIKRAERHATEFPAGILVDVASDGVTIRGFIKGVLQDSVAPSDFLKCSGSQILYCTFLAVHPDHQQKGIGRRLLKELRRRFPLPAYLVVQEKTGHAARMYLQEGFAFTGYVKDHISDSEGKRSRGYRMEAA